MLLKICLAIRQDEEAAARAAFAKALRELEGGALLRVVGDALMSALRRRRRDLFATWLSEAMPRLEETVGSRELAGESCAFLQSLAFAMCDRRLEEEMPLLQALVRRWLRVQDAAAGVGFWDEWLNLAARMARRGWRMQPRFLLRQTLWNSVRRRDAAFWRLLLARLNLHFTVFVRWDGFPKACDAYPELPLFYLLPVKWAGRGSLAAREREEYLLLALRGVRTLVNNAARSLMLEDTDIFRQWQQFLCRLAGDNARRQLELRLLLQLSIVYWRTSLPNTSRRQARVLEDLLQPDVIPADYRELLERIG